MSRHLITRPISLIFGFCIYAYLLMIGTHCQAQQPSNQITKLITPHGVLSVKQGASDIERVLDLDGRALLTDYHMRIDFVFPSEQDPKIVIASQDTGGNACCWENHLLDFTQAQPIVIEAPWPNREFKGGGITGYAKGITYQALGDKKGPLGEPLWDVCRYQYGSGKVQIIRSVPKYSYTTMKEKKYPMEVLDDPVRREPLVKLMGNGAFLDLRRHIELQSGFVRLSDTLFWAEGCTSHFCNSSAGAFLIDTAKNRAWAIYYDDKGGKFFGSFSAEDTLQRKAFDRWLSERKLSWPLFARMSKDANPPRPMARGTRTEIPLVGEAGVLKVPITLNGLIPLNFIVDSGASDVVIPADVVLTLMRTGTLSKADFIGSRTYRLADGSTVPSMTFRIKSMRIGNRVIENVTASMTGVDGVLLLGQSFLGRLERWSINNNRQVLEIE